MSIVINSSTTNYFDYTVNYNLYTRQVTINDASSYKAGGAALVSAESYTITSPSGISQTGTITPSAPVALVKAMAYLGTSIEIGNYIVTGVFTDQGGATYTLTKTTNICLPTQNDTSTGASGCVTLGWNVKCIDNIIIVTDQTSPTLTINGIIYTGAMTYGITLVNPLGAVLANNVNVPSFQIIPVVNGSYSVTINDTAVFSAGNGITVTVHYLLVTTKQAQCNINRCEFECAFSDLINKIDTETNTGSTDYRTWVSERDEATSLLELLDIQISCGGDTSTTLAKLNAILGTTCACGCGTSNVNMGVNVLLGQNIVWQAGNGITVTSTTIGNTTTVTYTNSKPETYKVLADAADDTPDYLDGKLESSDGSIAFSWDAANKQVNTKVSATWQKECLTFPVSFVAGEVGTLTVYFGYKVTVTGIWATVSTTIAGTDNGTITPKNNAGTAMTGGATTIVASSAVGTNVGLNAITANNVIGAAEVMQITTAKTTAGGRCLVTIQFSRTA